MSDLIKRDDAKLAITFTDEAHEMVALAIGNAAMVQKVDSHTTQALAVEAQKDCRRVLKLVEDARKEVKAPVLDFGRAIDDAAKKFVNEVAREELRVAKLIGDFQQAELARARSAEAARLKELQEMERAREEALSMAPTLEKRETIREEFSELTRAMQPPVAPIKVEGQTVREDWEIEITDIHELYRWHPQFVRLGPENAKKLEIREALNNGLTLRGIKATKTIKAGVRLGREPKAIELATP